MPPGTATRRPSWTTLASASRVHFAGVIVLGLEIPPPKGLVRQGPHQDAGVAAVPLDHLGELVHVIRGEIGIVLCRLDRLVDKRHRDLVLGRERLFSHDPAHLRLSLGVLGGNRDGELIGCGIG